MLCCPWNKACLFLLLCSLEIVVLVFLVLFSNSRDCRISNGVWINFYRVLPNILSTSWIYFDEIRYKRVLLIIVFWSSVHLDSEHKYTEIQRYTIPRFRDTTIPFSLSCCLFPSHFLSPPPSLLFSRPVSFISLFLFLFPSLSVFLSLGLSWSL